VRVPSVGETIEGKYRVERVLGEGGMGVVLAAHHELLDQRVAVKILTATDEKAIARFSFEAQSTARLKSEHVARVMDVGALPGGAPFMVMEYLEGCDLDELLRLNGPMPVQEAVGYVLQALEGLSQAHGLGLIHRDLKPANLFLAVDPSGAGVLKIVDFGISKSVVSRRSGKTGALTEENSTLGSPAYMAPEQIRASKDVDARADVWSLGVVLYELLSGSAPFSGEGIGAIFSAVLEKEAPVLKGHGIPAPLGAAVARCLRRDRGERYGDVLELARDLAPFGPPDSPARVARIEQTLQAAGARREGKDRPEPSVRIATGRVHARDPAAVAASLKATAGFVAFAADAPPDSAGGSATAPSIARRSRRSLLLAFAGAAGVGAVVAAASLVRPSTPEAALRRPASVSALPPPTPASSREPTPQPSPPGPSMVAAPGPTAPATVSPPKARPAVQPHRAASPAPVLARKHLGVLDSPD